MLKLMLRWKVLKEVAALLQIVGNAVGDEKLSSAERGLIMKQLWRVIRVYRGQRD